MIGTSDWLREQLACSRAYQVPHSTFLSWPELDQDKALAYERYLAGICPECRTPREEWQEDKFAYYADISQCPGCETVAQANKQLQTQLPEDEQGKGYFISLIPRAIFLAREAEREEV